VVAEKLEAIIVLGMKNSRMKGVSQPNRNVITVWTSVVESSTGVHEEVIKYRASFENW